MGEFTKRMADFDVVVHAFTDKAVRMSINGKDADAVWVPLSQCEVEPLRRNVNATCTMEERHALEYGLI